MPADSDNVAVGKIWERTVLAKERITSGVA